jgi:hypothetical protein
MTDACAACTGWLATLTVTELASGILAGDGRMMGTPSDTSSVSRAVLTPNGAPHDPPGRPWGAAGGALDGA